jgi:hypothetical protein
MNDLEDRIRDSLRARGAQAQIVDLTSAAQLRSRQLGRRRRALAIGGALPVVAGTAALGTAVALTIGSAPPALAAVTSALTRTLAQSYHLREQSGGYYIRNGRITNRYQVTCTTRADPVRHLEADSCSNGIATREVGRYTYLTVGGHPGKPWQRTPTACSDRLSKLAINGFTLATPQQMVSEIKKVGKVTVVGPASGHRWTGTRYAFRWRHGSLITISGTVDVDQQGRARNLALTIGLDSRPAKSVTKQVLMFSDFGALVRVTPPPADQTFVPRYC